MSLSLFQRILIQAVLLSVQSLLYFGCEKFQKNFHDVHRDIDDQIPLDPRWVWVYILWFPLIAIAPLSFYHGKGALLDIYLISIVLDIISSVVFYMLYPTTFERPEVPDTFSGRVLKMVYKGSYRGVNCMPSMHCSQCMILLITILADRELPLVLAVVYGGIALGIIYSTQATKQHVLVDFLMAIPQSILCFLFGYGIHMLIGG